MTDVARVSGLAGEAQVTSLDDNPGIGTVGEGAVARPVGGHGVPLHDIERRRGEGEGGRGNADRCDDPIVAAARLVGAEAPGQRGVDIGSHCAQWQRGGGGAMDDGIGINAGDFNGGIGNVTRCEEGDGIRRRAIRVGWVDAGEGVACQVGDGHRRRNGGAIGDGHDVGATRVERFGRMDGDGCGPGVARGGASGVDGWQRKRGIERASRRHRGAHALRDRRGWCGILGARDRHRGRYRDGHLVDELLEACPGAIVGGGEADRFGEGDRDR